MTLENFENLFCLFCTLIGLLSSLFRFIERPKKGYIFLIVFFLARFFSDYYWAIYVLTMHTYPNVSTFLAYIGWNISYVFLFLAAFQINEEKFNYFHPLMLWPLLTNIPLFILFIKFGGIFNNLWQTGTTTILMIFGTKDILFYFTHKKDRVPFHWFSFVGLIFLILEYGMWTASCFDWSSEIKNPYLYFTILTSLATVFFPWSIEKDYEIRGQLISKKTEAEFRLQTLLQTITSFFIIGDCIGGYFIAVWMKSRIPTKTMLETADSIVTMLFIISVILITVVIIVLHGIAYHYKLAKAKKRTFDADKLSKINFIITILITLILMTIAAVYNAKLLYDTGFFDGIESELVLNLLIFLLTFALISFFYYLGYKNERNYGKKVEELDLQVVMALASAIDAKDTYTNGHSARVAEYSKTIARLSGYSESGQDEIYMMGLLHDIGKIGIPDEVINKTGKLTEAEFELIKKHPVIGSNILKTIKDRPQLIIGARWHHERFDGKGYPDGRSGEDIPEEARIIAVADAYDAMTSNRSYRKIMPQEQVRSEIEKGIGTQFDPAFAKIMLAMIDDDTDFTMCSRSYCHNLT